MKPYQSQVLNQSKSINRLSLSKKPSAKDHGVYSQNSDVFIENQEDEDESVNQGSQSYGIDISERLGANFQLNNIEDFNDDMNENSCENSYETGKDLPQNSKYKKTIANTSKKSELQDKIQGNEESIDENDSQDQTIEQMFNCTQVNTPDNMRKIQTPLENQNNLNEKGDWTKKSGKDVEWYEIYPPLHRLRREQRENKDMSSKLIDSCVNTCSDQFDPVKHMTFNQIKCKKLHYSVPTFPSDIETLLSYDSEKNNIVLYDFQEVQQIMNNDKSINNLIPLKKVDSVVSIDQIQGFVFGSFTSRFWMLRIGINQVILDNSTRVNKSQRRMNTASEQFEAYKQNTDRHNHADKQEHEHSESPLNSSCSNDEFDTNTEVSRLRKDIVQLPFFAWECLSICLKNGHTVNLIIKDETQMKILVLFLIQKLKSFDGYRDTLNYLFKNNKNSRFLSLNQITQRVYQRYALMKIQMKISYEACRQCKTIHEHFLSAIIKTYNIRCKHGLIANPYPHISQSQLLNIKYLCLKKLTEENKLIEETRQKARNDLIVKGQISQKCNAISNCNLEYATESQKISIKRCSQISGHIPEEKNEIFNIVRAIFRSNANLDDQFINTCTKKGQQLQLVDEYVVQKKNKKGETVYSSKKELHHKHHKNDKLEKLKSTMQFKNKISLQEKIGLYQKLNLLIRLNLLEGPLYVYVIKELIDLSKQIFVIELQKGIEVTIPRYLTFKNWPLSYQFYSCLQEVIRQNFDVNTKNLLVKLQEQKQLKRNGSVVNQNITSLEHIKHASHQNNLDKMNLKIKKASKSIQSLDQIDYLFDQKLNQHSLEVQNGIYAQISQDQLRVKLHGLKASCNNTKSRSQSQKSYDRSTQQPMNPVNNLWYGHSVNISTLLKVKNQDLITNPNIQIVSHYLNSKKVAKKHKKLLSQKIHYQNQLTSLKEKGKRLILCRKIDLEIRGRKLEFLEEAENLIQQTQEKKSVCQEAQSFQLTDEEKKEVVQQMEQMIEHFNHHTIQHQEENVQTLRSKLVRSLNKAKAFDEKTKFINNKIEYDQRFFNSHYCEFQKMISDIRKQLAIKRDLFKSKKEKLKQKIQAQEFELENYENENQHDMPKNDQSQQNFQNNKSSAFPSLSSTPINQQQHLNKQMSIPQSEKIQKSQDVSPKYPQSTFITMDTQQNKKLNEKKFMSQQCNKNENSDMNQKYLQTNFKFK